MKSNPYYINEQYPDESLSSWLFRLRVRPINKIQLSGCPHAIEDDKDEQSFSTSASYIELNQDPDYSLSACDIELLRHMGFSTLTPQKSAADNFRSIVPLHYRRSYCCECIFEAMKLTGYPISLITWRHVLEPFCIKHNRLLRDAPRKFSTNSDFSKEVFKSHFRARGAVEHLDSYVKANAKILKLSLKVQTRINQTLNDSGTFDEKQSIENFMMTLTRAVMLPCMSSSYDAPPPWRLREDVVYEEEHASPYTTLYLQPLRASTIERARSLYLAGLLLGWISEREAKLALGNHLFRAASAGDVWSRIRRAGSHFTEWIFMSLKRFETLDLSLSVLQENHHGWGK